MNVHVQHLNVVVNNNKLLPTKWATTCTCIVQSCVHENHVISCSYSDMIKVNEMYVISNVKVILTKCQGKHMDKNNNEEVYDYMYECTCTHTAYNVVVTNVQKLM